MHFVYILESLSTHHFYIGRTDHLLRRFHQHRSGQNKSTRNRGPWWMPYYEIYATREEAAAREAQLKRMKSAKAIRNLISNT
jgi:predicted GIY-YIG superfamily endonuclease